MKVYTIRQRLSTMETNGDNKKAGKHPPHRCKKDPNPCDAIFCFRVWYFLVRKRIGGKEHGKEICIGNLETNTAVILLGIGLACAGISMLQEK